MTARDIKPVHLIHGGLDDSEERGGSIILRGRVLPESLQELKTDYYQREVQPQSSLESILEALEKNVPLPDIELAVRSQKFSSSKDTFQINDTVYIIDGLQRVAAALIFLQRKPSADIRLGATVHFSTNATWEKDRFRKLNMNRIKVAPSIILRNERESHPVIGMLYGLSVNDKCFPLYGQVCWRQRMAKADIITGLTYLRTVTNLHAHNRAGARSTLTDVMAILDAQVAVVGMNNYRDNVQAFFTLLEECWGAKLIQNKEFAIHMRWGFLGTLAKLLSDHHDFWTGADEKKLFISADLRRKLKQFNLLDPQVINLVGASGKARNLLYMLLRDHINSGKRTKRLTSRVKDNGVELEAEDEAE